MAGILMLFLAALVLLQAYFFALDRIHIEEWEVDVRGHYTVTGQVVQWEYVVAVIFMAWSFAVAIPGAIFSFRGTRFTIALIAGVSLLISAIVVPADTYDFGLSFTYYEPDFLFYPLLGGMVVGLLILSRPLFHPDRQEQIPTESKVSGIRDGYGWKRGDVQ
jgi:hypothetical protein